MGRPPSQYFHVHRTRVEIPHDENSFKIWLVWRPHLRQLKMRRIHGVVPILVHKESSHKSRTNTKHQDRAREKDRTKVQVAQEQASPKRLQRGSFSPRDAETGQERAQQHFRPRQGQITHACACVESSKLSVDARRFLGCATYSTLRKRRSHISDERNIHDPTTHRPHECSQKKKNGWAKGTALSIMNVDHATTLLWVHERTAPYKGNTTMEMKQCKTRITRLRGVKTGPGWLYVVILLSCPRMKASRMECAGSFDVGRERWTDTTYSNRSSPTHAVTHLACPMGLPKPAPRADP